MDLEHLWGAANLITDPPIVLVMSWAALDSHSETERKEPTRDCRTVRPWVMLLAGSFNEKENSQDIQ